VVNDQEADMDQVARDRILHDLDTTFLVEAGAGSGKTTSLVGRMINLVKSGKARVEEIAAITFTNKAAAELQTRFRMKLEEEWQTCTAANEQERLGLAIQNMNQAFIGTIHSFCGQLLRQRSIEAGLDPSFSELDERQSAEFRNQCWDAYLEQLREQGQEDRILRLADLDIHVEDMRAVYLRVSEYEDVEIFRRTVERPDCDRVRLSLPPMLDEAVKWMPQSAPDPDWDGLQKLVREARWMLRILPLSDDRNVLKLAKLFDKTIQVTLKRWTDKDSAKEMEVRFKQWQIQVLKPFLQDWREFLHPQVIDFVLPAVSYCRQRRLEAALVDFQDLLMRSTVLLREHLEVRRYFARRYRFLLVDEFQDTDPIQAEMMMLLTGEDECEHDWKKLTPRQGSLFIVGDPKQSIYRFRRADISIYNFVKKRVAENGDVLELTRNFRSVQSIGHYVNYAFESKFALPGVESAIQASYVRMLTEQSNPKDKKSIHGVYTLTWPKVDYDRKAVIADMDSERIAKWIAWACRGNLMIQDRGEDSKPSSRPAEPGDFMILLKRREFINLYAEKLEKYGIPSDMSGSKVAYEEIRALVQLVKCLNDTTDRIPLLAVLRGLLFGVSDDALYHYKREHGSIRLYMLPEAADVSTKAKPCYDALLTLQQYDGWVRRLPAWTVMARIVRDLGMIPYSAVKESGTIRSGTLVKLLQMVQANVNAAADWHELYGYLGQLLDAGTDGLESTSMFAGTGNAVRIMNLHKAKGLEAPVVFMACPCGNVDHDAEEHIDRLAEPALGYFTISRPKDAYNKELIAQPVRWVELSEKEREFTHAEEDRLLYVATTRARQLLVVSRYPSKPTIDPWSALEETLAKQTELEEVEAELVQAEMMAEADALDMEEALADWNSWYAEASKATFQRTSVTEQVKTGSDMELHRPAEGRGMAFGSVVHRALEALGNGMDMGRLEAFIRSVASEEELKDVLVPDAMETVNTVIQSDIWQRGLNAKMRYHEFSFLLSKKSDDGTDSIVKGVIDFLFEEEDGWVIVDFKTDIFEEKYEHEFVAYYKPQVLAYVEEWERFGYRVKEAGLYFLNSNKYVTV
jgi:ATP-dependent helicase/nuclease subunit A